MNGGNRFIFPGLHFDKENTCYADIWAYCRKLCAALGVTEEQEKLVLEVDSGGYVSLTHVVTTIMSSGFLHGSETAWLIGGPEYEKVKHE